MQAPLRADLIIEVAKGEHARQREYVLAQRKLSLRQGLPEDGSLPPALLQAYRVAVMGAEDLYFLQPNSSLDFISNVNEMSMLKTLKKQLQSLASAHPAISAYQKPLRTVAEMCTSFCIKPEPPISTLMDAKARAMFDWTAREGIDCPYRLADFASTGRGVVTIREIKEGEVIRLPRELIFNIDAAMSSPLAKIFNALETDPDTILLLFTIHERYNPTSPWAPYFALLPESIPSGLFFEGMDLKALDGTPLMMDILTIKETLLASYNGLFPSLSEQYPEVFPEEHFTYEQFIWARAMFDSRGFLIDIGGQQKNCLLPMIDFMNTSPRAQMEGRGQFNPATDSFEIRTLAPVQAGAQLYLTYGNFSNREHVLYYGYFDPNCPNDSCAIGFALPDDDPGITARKEAALEREGLSLHEHSVRIGPFSRRLLATLRLSICNATELAQYEAGARPEEPGSSRLEREIYTTLRVTLDGLLSELHQAEDETAAAAAEDPEILAESDRDHADDAEEITETRRLALAYKKRYEEVLNSALEEVETALAKI